MPRLNDLSWLAIKSAVRGKPELYGAIVAGRRVNRVASHMLTGRLSAKSVLRESLCVDKYIVCNSYVSANFGDAVSPQIVRAISRKTPVPLVHTLALRGRPSYSVVGSVLQFPASPHTEVWGSGFIHKGARFVLPPARIHAVRGPLTRELCLSQGLKCPEIYGDPAVLLFDKFRALPRIRTYKLGLIPHYADADHPVIRELEKNDAVKLIDVHSPVRQIAEECLQCDFIASSSLHGLILADSLEIPSRWLGVSGLVMKGGFKFQDYFLSVQRDESTPLMIDDLTLERVASEARLLAKPFSRQGLLDVCPFRHEDVNAVADIEFSQI